MSEAEQSREPQQDRSTDSTAPEPGDSGEASGEPAPGEGPDAPGRGAAAVPAARTGSRSGGREADAGTDAPPGAEVESGGAATGALPAVVPPARRTTESAPARSGAAPARGSGRGAASGRDPEGRLLSGRYRLGGVLGRGGMGTVWRAEDETLGRTVAVKELRFPNSIDDEEKRRLITRTLREAKAIARIRNNSAVTVYDVVDEDDRPWIVMELVEGKSLAEVIREDGTLTPRRAAEVGLAILDVLRSAHREGILHRDVKPSNVLIADDGRVVLTDFGIAQVEGDPSITSTGMLVGAPSYISPERARGHRPGPAADLWSLGGLLYASVEGCPPYDKGSAIATLTAVMTEPLDPPKNAGPLEEVIYGLLAKDPEQRLDDRGARALLTKVLLAPDAPASPEPPVDATRAMAIPPMPPPAPRTKTKGPAPRSGPPAAAGGALGGPGIAPRAAPVPPRPPVQRATPVRASLTDVVPRRTLVIIAVVVALAVVATGVFLTLRKTDDSQNEGKGDAAVSAGAKTPGGEETPGDKSPDGEPGRSADSGTDPDSGTDSDPRPEDSADSDSSSPSDSGSASAKAPDDKLPKGYGNVSNGRFRFSMAMPEGFRMTGVAGQNSGGIFSESGGFPRVQVDFNDSPKDDAAAAWNAAVPGTRAQSDGYRHGGVRTVEYKGYPTVADWSFERNQKGERIRVLNRGFKVDAEHGYSIMVSCPAGDWDKAECKTLRDTAFATFKPKG